MNFLNKNKLPGPSRFLLTPRVSKISVLISVSLLLLVVIAGHFIELGQMPEFMNEDVKLVKRLDDFQLINRRFFSRYNRYKKQLENGAQKSVLNKQDFGSKSKVFDIAEYRRSSTGKGWRSPKVAVRRELLLHRIEATGTKKNKNLFNEAEYSGVLEIEGSTILNFNISSNIINIDIPGSTKIINNYVFSYEIEGNVYSATLLKQKNGNQYIVTLSNGPYANTKLTFATNEQIEKLAEMKLAQEEQASQKRELSAFTLNDRKIEGFVKRREPSEVVTNLDDNEVIEEDISEQPAEEIEELSEEEVRLIQKRRATKFANQRGFGSGF